MTLKKIDLNINIASIIGIVFSVYLLISQVIIKFRFYGSPWISVLMIVLYGVIPILFSALFIKTKKKIYGFLLMIFSLIFGISYIVLSNKIISALTILIILYYIFVYVLTHKRIKYINLYETDCEDNNEPSQPIIKKRFIWRFLGKTNLTILIIIYSLLILFYGGFLFYIFTVTQVDNYNTVMTDFKNYNTNTIGDDYQTIKTDYYSFKLPKSYNKATPTESLVICYKGDDIKKSKKYLQVLPNSEKMDLGFSFKDELLEETSGKIDKETVINSFEYYYGSVPDNFYEIRKLCLKTNTDVYKPFNLINNIWGTVFLLMKDNFLFDSSHVYCYEHGDIIGFINYKDDLLTFDFFNKNDTNVFYALSFFNQKKDLSLAYSIINSVEFNN